MVYARAPAPRVLLDGREFFEWTIQASCFDFLFAVFPRSVRFAWTSSTVAKATPRPLSLHPAAGGPAAETATNIAGHPADDHETHPETTKTTHESARCGSASNGCLRRAASVEVAEA